MIEKKPQAGEFWELNERVKIVGPLSDGATVGETSSGSIRTFKHENGWTHLPDCDSFDWQPETFPQCIVSDTGIAFGSGKNKYYIRRLSSTAFEYVYADRTEGTRLEWGLGEADAIRIGAWKQVSQAEAESLVKKPSPVESPDDWVTQDRVGARPGIDERRFLYTAESYTGMWQDVGKYSSGMLHNSRADGDTVELRCRRRDLPPMPQETPKREYVRCFTTLEGTVRTAKDISEFDMSKIWCELKHDGTGFYLEDSK